MSEGSSNRDIPKLANPSYAFKNRQNKDYNVAVSYLSQDFKHASGSFSQNKQA